MVGEVAAQRDAAYRQIWARPKPFERDRRPCLFGKLTRGRSLAGTPQPENQQRRESEQGSEAMPTPIADHYEYDLRLLFCTGLSTPRVLIMAITGSALEPSA